MKGQIWIETVIYTLIALTIIGIVLGIVKPALDEQKDKVSIGQSIDTLNAIDQRIGDIEYVAGNSRNIEMKITRGVMVIDGKEDKIRIIIEDSNYAPSEVNVTINQGSIQEFTNSSKGKYYVSLTLDYSGKFNITSNKKDIVKTFQYAPTPYILVVRNNGQTPANIDFS
jgi:hypothetical protein